MEQLWAPWRMSYVTDTQPTSNCIFCCKEGEGELCDRERLILWRAEHAFVMMNRYPYNCGHLLIAPYCHTATLADLDRAVAGELFSLLLLSQQVLHQAMAPHGYNIGMNLGTVAGAGIADHLHLHIVPRWSGDTNFMTVLSEVRTIPQHLDETCAKLRQLFTQLGSGTTK